MGVDVSIQIRYEVHLLWYSFLTGVWLIAMYDVLRVFRLFVHHGSLWTGLEDIGYWIYACIITFAMLFEQNDGQLRGYAIAGVFFGMILYDRIFSRFFLKTLKKVLKCITMKFKHSKKTRKLRTEKRKNCKAGE